MRSPTPRSQLTLTLNLTLALLCACATPAPKHEAPPPSSTPAARENPLLVESTLPDHAPPFDKLLDGDYKPAFEEGMRQQLAEVQAIADNPAPPTFENTVVAMEKTGLLLTRVSVIFNGVSSANTNPTLQKVQEEIAAPLAAHQDAIHLNAKLFARIDAVYSSARS